MLSLSCRIVGNGAALECARSKIIVRRAGASCSVGNRLTASTFVRVRPGMWQADLPVRIDTLRCEGSLCSFEEAEKADATHPNPPQTRYDTISSPAMLVCPAMKFDVF